MTGVEDTPPPPNQSPPQPNPPPVQAPPPPPTQPANPWAATSFHPKGTTLPGTLSTPVVPGSHPTGGGTENTPIKTLEQAAAMGITYVSQTPNLKGEITTGGLSNRDLFVAQTLQNYIQSQGRNGAVSKGQLSEQLGRVGLSLNPQTGVITDPLQEHMISEQTQHQLNTGLPGGGLGEGAGPATPLSTKLGSSLGQEATGYITRDAQGNVQLYYSPAQAKSIQESQIVNKEYGNLPQFQKEFVASLNKPTGPTIPNPKETSTTQIIPTEVLLNPKEQGNINNLNESIKSNLPEFGGSEVLFPAKDHTVPSETLGPSHLVITKDFEMFLKEQSAHGATLVFKNAQGQIVGTSKGGSALHDYLKASSENAGILTVYAEGIPARGTIGAGLETDLSNLIYNTQTKTVESDVLFSIKVPEYVKPLAAGYNFLVNTGLATEALAFSIGERIAKANIFSSNPLGLTGLNIVTEKQQDIINRYSLPQADIVKGVIDLAQGKGTTGFESGQGPLYDIPYIAATIGTALIGSGVSKLPSVVSSALSKTAFKSALEFSNPLVIRGELRGVATTPEEMNSLVAAKLPSRTVTITKESSQVFEPVPGRFVGEEISLGKSTPENLYVTNIKSEAFKPIPQPVKPVQIFEQTPGRFVGEEINLGKSTPEDLFVTNIKSEAFKTIPSPPKPTQIFEPVPGRFVGEEISLGKSTPEDLFVTRIKSEAFKPIPQPIKPIQIFEQTPGRFVSEEVNLGKSTPEDLFVTNVRVEKPLPEDIGLPKQLVTAKDFENQFNIVAEGNLNDYKSEYFFKDVMAKYNQPAEMTDIEKATQFLPEAKPVSNKFTTLGEVVAQGKITHFKQNLFFRNPESYGIQTVIAKGRIYNFKRNPFFKIEPETRTKQIHTMKTLFKEKSLITKPKGNTEVKSRGGTVTVLKSPETKMAEQEAKTEKPIKVITISKPEEVQMSKFTSTKISLGKAKLEKVTIIRRPISESVKPSSAEKFAPSQRARLESKPKMFPEFKTSQTELSQSFKENARPKAIPAPRVSQENKPVNVSTPKLSPSQTSKPIEKQPSISKPFTGQPQIPSTSPRISPKTVPFTSPVPKLTTNIIQTQPFPTPSLEIPKLVPQIPPEKPPRILGGEVETKRKPPFKRKSIKAENANFLGNASEYSVLGLYNRSEITYGNKNISRLARKDTGKSTKDYFGKIKKGKSKALFTSKRSKL